MTKSFRIKANPGVDRNIKVQIDQDFDLIEILSLKLRQEELYTKFCSDYGVVAGRVIANGGYGVPNVMVSVFVPLTTEDEIDPVISTLYPYKQLTDKNEDGYRYNLLPYVQEYGGHTPTGTFPDVNDILTRNEVLEIYEKYYKFTVRTNESGDFMIVGVPLGMQKIVMDADLSNIGCFSLRPSDLIRMGIGVNGQFDGPQFRSNTNLEMLPQIVNEIKEVEVDSFWGDEEFCTIGITRVDFDLRDSGIEINPQCVFLGSIFSNSDEDELKVNCKPSIRTGSLCDMVTQAGRVLAIRQTIFNDANGFPVLEQYKFEDGGNIIDDNGTWLVEVPMNLDYVTTNEFGEQILSNDPKVGIPTKGKYRFRLQYQNEDPENSNILRADYLVPNIKEYGWSLASVNEPDDFDLQQKSYAFSLDWAEYGDPTTTLGRQIIQEAIDCEDKFFEFNYNRVYTVSGHIDRWKWGYLTSRILGIREITDRACTATTNRFPTNDAFFKFDIIFFVVYFTLGIFYPLIYVFIVVLHVLAWLYDLIVRLWNGLANFWNNNIVNVCYKINDVFDWFNWDLLNCDNWLLELIEPQNPFARYSLPMISYPDCDNCPCEIVQVPDELLELYQDSGNFSALVDSNSVRTYNAYNENAEANIIRANDPDPETTELNYDFTNETLNAAINQGFAGYVGDTSNNKDRFYKTPVVTWPTQFSPSAALSFISTWSQKLNQLNSRQGFFDGNRITTTVKNLHPVTNVETPSQPFLDQPLILVCDQGTLSSLGTPGSLLTFTKVEDVYDPNISAATLNQFGTKSITGTAASNLTNLVTRQVSYLNNNGTQSTVNLYLKLTEPEKNYNFKAGTEYFQMITGGTMQQFQDLIDFNQYAVLQKSVFEHGMKFRWGKGIATTSTVPFGGSEFQFNNTVHAIKVDSSGGIYVGGEFTSYESTSCNRIIKLTSAGSVDNTFSFGTGFSSTVRSIDIQSDGKLVIGGDFTSYSGSARNRIIRLNTNGTIDNTFNIGTGFNQSVYVVKVQPSDQKILVGGNFTQYSGVSKNRIVRLTTTGLLDAFNNTGANDIVRDIAVQSNNSRILVGGDFTTFNGSNRFYAVRLLILGGVDSTFSTTTPTTTPINGPVYTIKQSLDGTGDIYMGGEFTVYRGDEVGRIVKLNSTGTRITTFTHGNFSWTPAYDFDNRVRVIYNYLDANNNEKLLVGGDFSNYIDENGLPVFRPQIARITADGNYDTTFNLSTSWNINTGVGQGVYSLHQSSVAPFYVTIGGSFSDSSVGFRIKRVLDNGSNYNVSVASSVLQLPGYTTWKNVARQFPAYPKDVVSNFLNKEIVILTRGVDPYTQKQRIEYDLSNLLGRPANSVTVLGDYYINVPSQLSLNSNGGWQIPNITVNTWRNDKWTPESHLVINNSNQRLFHRPFCSLQSQSLFLNNFSAFTNNSLKYYSSLDKSLSTFYSFAGDGYNVGNFTTPQGVASPLTYTWQQGKNTIGTTWFTGGLIPITMNDTLFSNSALPIGNIEGSTLIGSNISPGITFNIDAAPSSNNFARVFSPAYHLTNPSYDCTMVNGNRIVFRSDRLPTSTSTQIAGNSSYALFMNDNFKIYKVLEGGVTTELQFSPFTPLNVGTSEDFADRPSGSTVSDLVINSLSCDGMTLLSCYSGNGETFGVIEPCAENFDGNLEKQNVIGGCYYFVSKKYLSVEELTRDANNLAEWKSRFIFSFAACREIFSHMFQNNWVNGGLYMFNFQRQTIFDLDNNPTYRYCGSPNIINAPYQGPIYYDDLKNSFFYRSAPYSHQISNFVGQEPRKKSWLTGQWESALDYGGINTRNLFFPTTIMDLGPRDQFTKEICLNPQLEGYLVETLKTTSFNPTDTLLLFFFLSRLLSTSNANKYLGFGNASVFALFSRSGLRIDGDVAQMFSINSEYGILPFNDQFYDDNDVFLYSSNNKAIMGVLYSASTENRRLLTPGTLTFGNVTQYNGYPKTQEVPMYKWTRDDSDGYVSILGTENNNWDTSYIGIYSTYFQNMAFDTTDYFKTTNGPNTGYIFNYDNNQNPTFAPSTNQSFNRFVVGAPYHFYFGLLKGKSSLNRYIVKYIIGTI